MSPNDLRSLGEALFDEHWQARLAQEIGVADRTVRRWLSGRLSIGPAMEERIRTYAARRGRAVPGEVALHHVTLNTGNLTVTRQGDVTGLTMELLRPMIEVGHGEAAGIPFAISHRRPGAALFGIGDPPAVLCGACWSKDGSQDAWEAMLAACAAGGLPRAPAAEPEVPWLAVMLTPAMMALPMDQIRMLGDLERCLAWTMIDAGA